jgi:hypothetical protein
MNPWESVFDRAQLVLLNGLRPFLKNALDKPTLDGKTGWELLHSQQISKGIRSHQMSSLKIEEWSADHCLNVLRHHLELFENEFVDTPRDRAEAAKAKKAREGRINDLLIIRDGWVNDLLLLRNEKSHITGSPFSDHQGERFIINASALLRSAGADSAAAVLDGLLKNLHNASVESRYGTNSPQFHHLHAAHDGSDATKPIVTEPKKYLSVVISHASEDENTAQHLKRVLSDAGLTVITRPHPTGLQANGSTLSTDHVCECHFLVFLISFHSRQSQGVQRDLGLARRLRRQTRGYRPVLIGVYTHNQSDASRRFPVRDFETNSLRTPLDLDGIHVARGEQKDIDELLLSYMRPTVWISRHNFQTEDVFHETKVFALYQRLFPRKERDDPEDIKRWVLRADLGQVSKVEVPNAGVLEYQLDSRYFILTVANKAVGLAFLTYDASTQLMYGNYIAIEEAWRSGDLARHFVNIIVDALGMLFPEYRGIVFEVEKINKSRLKSVLMKLSKTRGKARYNSSFLSKSEKEDFAKALRIMWYEHINCDFFLDSRSMEPITCKSPCLNPLAKRWSREEAEFWLMWYHRPGLAKKVGSVRPLWEEAVGSVYLEILAKSLVAAYPKFGQAYWQYARERVEEIINIQTGDVEYGKFLQQNPALRKRIATLRKGMAI